MKKGVLAAVLFFFILFLPQVSFAGEIDFDLMGLSYHLHKDGAYRAAPNKLDHGGVWVFNPGMALGYDFRQDIHTEGLSPIVHAGFFQNCFNTPFVFAGAGARYRKFITKKLFWETNVMGVLTYGNDWDNKAYKLAPMPYANVGIGYDFGKKLVIVSLSYIPKGSGNTVTTGTDMLFMNVSIAF